MDPFTLNDQYEIFRDVFEVGVGGIMVSIAAFQAVDPGSIPGRRNFLFGVKVRLHDLTWMISGLTAKIT